MKNIWNMTKIKKLSYLKSWDINSLYRWKMSQKLIVNDLKWAEDIYELNEGIMKNCNNESDKGYFLWGDVQFPEDLHNLHDKLHFFPEEMEIEKVGKLVGDLHDKEEYVIHIRNLKKAFTHSR